MVGGSLRGVKKNPPIATKGYIFIKIMVKQSMECSPNFVSISIVKNIKINLEKLKRKEKKKGKELSNQFNKLPHPLIMST
jgi:hypothetical protein